MVQGTFFKVDTDSLLGEGQVVFRYLPVCRRPHDESKKHHHFPVYAVLKPFSIDFYYHGPDIGKDANKEDIHVHACILHLPLSLNLAVKDNLTARLSRMFYDVFRISKEYKFDISEKPVAYWNMDVFKGNKGGYKEESKYKSDSTTGTQIVLRKLVLDFIFDLEHSRVFEASPHYEEVEVHLRENFFFNAIAAKAAYYYNRKKYLDNLTNYDVGDLYAHSLADAELQWLNIIRDEKATKVFWHEDWFKEVEKESKGVLFDKSFNRSVWRSQLDNGKNNTYEQKNIWILRESARWYLRRYNFTKGMKAIFQFYSGKKVYFLLLGIVTFFIIPAALHIYNAAELDSSLNDNLFADMVYVFLGIIPFLLLTSLFLYKMFLPLVGALLPRLLMAISSSWLFFSTTEELVKSSFDIQVFDINKIWVFLLLIPVILFMVVEIKNMAPDINAKNLLKRMLVLLSIGFIYSLLIGMFFINSLNRTILVRSGYLEEFYRTEIQNKDNIDIKIDSSTAVFFGQSYLKNKAQFFGLLNYIPDKCKYRYLKYITYKISWLNQRAFRIRYDIPIIKNKLSFEIFPGMLLYRAVFALFIGIFVQLIFEDKPITEPL